jgi:Fe-S cluster assembly protein SufD
MSTDTYVGLFDSSADTRAGEPAALSELRRGAIARFAELGFPSTRDEEWRNTNVGPLARASFGLADSHNSVSSEEAGEFVYEGCDHLVFVNGRYSSELSSVGELPAGVVVGSLRELRSNGVNLEHHLAKYASFSEHAFVALNTALHEDGAVVLLPRGVVLERPIQWVFLSSGDVAQKAAFPRNLIVAGENSQATIVESYVGLTGETYFNCVVTEIVCEANSVVQHYKVQKEGTGAFHLATQQAHLGRSANLTSLSITEGGRFVRNDVNAMLAAEGVECTLNGLYVLTDRQFVDNHMRVEHQKPHCDSHELYKGILDGHSRAVFNGRIYVHPDAQKTDAKQTNRNLLLSKDALVNSNPQLEIFADDVKCTHGSTVGQLDEDALFYLRSRGIDLDAARSLLTWAFASELVDTIRVDAVRDDVERLMFSRLTSSDVVRDAI